MKTVAKTPDQWAFQTQNVVPALNIPNAINPYKKVRMNFVFQNHFESDSLQEEEVKKQKEK